MVLKGLDGVWMLCRVWMLWYVNVMCYVVMWCVVLCGVCFYVVCGVMWQVECSSAAGCMCFEYGFFVTACCLLNCMCVYVYVRVYVCV